MNFGNFTLKKDPYKYAISQVDLPFTYDELIIAIDNESPNNKLISLNDNFQKTEIRKSDSHGIISELLEMMLSENLVRELRNLFDVESLSSDITFDGGGLTITEIGGYLRYHADFPYSNQAQKYRVINCLLYLASPDIVGGELHLIDPSTKTVEGIVNPVWGRLLAFPTTRYTPHGFPKVKRGKRIGVNAYFYADLPLDDRYLPGKTEWL